uniref:NIDO domain-containing protein n=1 Tax=Ciona savignyi TaxID=51511 RepID=H2Z8V3_CIOSA
MVMFPARRYSGLTSTFQCVIASDGLKSFVLFIYQPGQMLWKPSLRLDNKLLTGFGNTDGLNAIKRGIYSPDKSSNIGVNGIYMYEYSYEQRKERKCLEWISRQTPPPSIFRLPRCAPNSRLLPSSFVEVTFFYRALGIPSRQGSRCYNRMATDRNTVTCCYNRGRFSFGASSFQRIT